MSKKLLAKNEKFKETSEQILKEVGGKENISNVTHCMTRLRFNLKDKSIPEKEKIQNIPGVIGVVEAGGQLQIIMGQTVSKVYEVLCEVAGIKIGENMDTQEGKHKKMTFKSIGNSILDGLAGSLTPLIPLLMAASIFKLLGALLGPSMLNMISEGSDLFKLFTFVGDAGFYFLPIIVGYTSAKKFGVTPVLGMLMGGVLLHPTFIKMAEEGVAFTVYGMPSSVQNYASSVLPIILTVWVMSYIEKFFKKHLPEVLKTVFTPPLTILVMLPISLCVLAPAGGIVGDYICNGLLSASDLGGVAGILAIAVIAAVYEFLVMSGMHLVLISALILAFSANGFDGVVMPAASAASLAVPGMCLGVALRLKKKEEKSLSIGYLIASIVGGVTEPGLYGVGIRYRRPFLGLMIGGFAGGLYAAILGVKAYTLVPVANALIVLNFAGGPTSNFVHGLISGVIAFVVAAVTTYFIGVKEENTSNTSV